MVEGSEGLRWHQALYYRKSKGMDEVPWQYCDAQQQVPSWFSIEQKSVSVERTSRFPCLSPFQGALICEEWHVCLWEFRWEMKTYIWFTKVSYVSVHTINKLKRPNLHRPFRFCTKLTVLLLPQSRKLWGNNGIWINMHRNRNSNQLIWPSFVLVVLS